MSIQTVPLSSLQPPAANPRTVFDSAALDGLAASIKSDGLLQNLVVVPVKGKTRRYRIVSGERRFRALTLLLERGDIAADHDVPVEIRDGLSKDDVLRLATIENLQREDLPPLDQAAAFAGLIRKGTTLDDIVAKTGISTTTIRRRLVLNTLCDEARAALADGTLTLSHAEALTLGTAEAQQLILLEIAAGHKVSPDEIREHFIDDRPSVAIAIFPLDRYTGTITTDLFQAAEESYFDDGGQFMALQRQAVEDLAKSYDGKAAWVEVTDHYRIPEWQFEQAEDGQPAGVVINLSPRGTVEVREGLLRSADIDAETADATAETPLAPSKRTTSYSTPLRRYLAWHKTLAVQELLLAHARKARELSAVAQLVHLAPHMALHELAKQPDAQVPYTVVDTHAAMIARRIGLESDGEEGVGWKALTYAGGDAEVYAVIKTLSDDELDQLLLVLAVLPFGQHNCDRLDTGDSLFNAVARDLAIDMRNHWRPDGDFLNRRTRDQLITIGKQCGFADGHSALHTWKKAELVTGLLRHFEHARSAAAPNEAQAKALAWLPEAMQFPAIDPDAPPQSPDGGADDDDAPGDTEDAPDSD